MSDLPNEQSDKSDEQLELLRQQLDIESKEDVIRLGYYKYYRDLNIPYSLFKFNGGSTPQNILQQKDSLITVDTIKGLVQAYLLQNYDVPVPIPPFHELMWRMYIDPYPFVVIAAPRGHAKTTSNTHTYGITSLLFRDSDYALLVSDTEFQATMFLADIIREFTENTGLIKDFGIAEFVRDTQTDVEIRCNDNHRFKIQVRGAEQKCRGLKWRGKRPNLVLVDDLENDELVESDLRREKLRKWFFNALLPACSERARVRICGTVLHFDSLLYRLLHDEGWFSCTLRASNDVSDFRDVLWKRKFPEVRLKAIKDTFKRQNNLAGFSQEYYNEPINEEDAFFKRSDFNHEVDEIPSGLTYYAGCDFAISKDKKACYTCFGVIGVDTEGYWYVVDVMRGHWDTEEIVDNLFLLHLTYKPELIAVEKGQIWDTLEPIFNTECRNIRVFPRLFPVQAIKDKRSRARSLQFKMRSGMVFWDKSLPWFDECFLEMIRFDRGPTKDQVDALSWAARMIEDMIALPEIKQNEVGDEEEEEDEETFSFVGNLKDRTRDSITGY